MTKSEQERLEEIERTSRLVRGIFSSAGFDSETELNEQKTKERKYRDERQKREDDYLGRRNKLF